MEYIIALAVVCLFLGVVCVVLICKVSDQKKMIDRQHFRIKYLEKPPRKRNRDHANAWNDLWSMIKQKFNIYRLEDGTTHGGIAALEIKRSMKEKFGMFNLDQIRFIRHMISTLKKVCNNQVEYEAALNPVGKEIIFTPEGGFRVEPSRN